MRTAPKWFAWINNFGQIPIKKGLDAPSCFLKMRCGSFDLHQIGFVAENMRRWFSFEKWEDKIFSKRGLPFDRLRNRCGGLDTSRFVGTLDHRRGVLNHPLKYSGTFQCFRKQSLPFCFRQRGPTLRPSTGSGTALRSSFKISNALILEGYVRK